MLKQLINIALIIIGRRRAKVDELLWALSLVVAFLYDGGYGPFTIHNVM
jgi:hypothetical protein